jgi:hypothetical protein
MIGLLVTVLSLVLVGEWLAIGAVGVRMRAVTVTLASICILSENGLLRRLLVLLIVRIHRALQRSETSGASLHRLSQAVVLERSLVARIALSWSPIAHSGATDRIHFSSANYR